jgi:leucyl-tRNA---protein transferase
VLLSENGSAYGHHRVQEIIIMILLQETRLSDFTPCSYIPELMWRFEYFFAHGLDGRELDLLLQQGWRKFGYYYFRPNCGECRRCIPIRILARELSPGKSQRRIAKKCANIEVRFGDLDYRKEIFDIYSDHSLNRFGKESDEEDFFASFYTQSCPALQSEYYLDGELIAVGFLDVSRESLSSVYFIYNTAYEDYRLGTCSVIRESEYAASRGLTYYYLGYYIEENQSMAYKGHFHPNEKYDWETRRWIRE